ncbi:MAG: ribosomal-processing cysteine protease Prp [Bacilli bacterium]
MTTVNVVYHEDGTIWKITVSGHSDYGKNGSDIVCSAVSTAMYVSRGLIEKSSPDYYFHEDEKAPVMQLEIRQTTEFTNLIMENLVTTLQGISKNYAKYLKINLKK